MTTRRTFLIGAGAAIAGCQAAPGRVGRRRGGPDDDSGTPAGLPGGTPVGTTEPTDPWSYEPGPEPAPWQPPGTEDPVAFAFGVQTGDAVLDGVLVSCRTLEPSVTCVVVRGTDAGWEEVQRHEGLVPDDKVTQLELVDLVPDTTYAVAFYAEDGSDRRSSPARVRTALYPGSTRVVKFAATSCLGGNEPWESLSRAAAYLPDFFVLLGDTIYADPDWGQDFDHEADWEAALIQQGLRDISQATSLVATWDDHEVRNDWRGDDDDMPAFKDVALTAFRRAIPMREGSGAISNLWRRLAWGDTLELFVLDCRSERFGDEYVSREQLDWLKQGLVDSTARFKIVCNSVPICDMDDVYFGIAAEDRWDGYAAQRSELLDWIRDSGAEGVLFIAGDFHWGALATIGRPGFDHDDLYEVFCGPGGSTINPLMAVVNANDHYLEVIKRHNVTLFEADPAAGTVRVLFVADDGSVIADRTLTL